MTWKQGRDFFKKGQNKTDEGQKWTKIYKKFTNIYEQGTDASDYRKHERSKICVEYTKFFDLTV